jgi:hypothetical protein
MQSANTYRAKEKRIAFMDAGLLGSSVIPNHSGFITIAKLKWKNASYVSKRLTFCTNFLSCCSGKVISGK